MARAIWKANLCLGEERVPVKLYSAVEDRNIHFHLLHDQDMIRVRQRMVHPVTNETVATADAHRGYEFERGRFVLLSDEELESLEPEASRDIEIAEFVEPAQINHQWYVRPYWLGPDESDNDYFALAEALTRSGKEGVAHWVMRKKSYHGALRVNDGRLLLITLRNASEVIAASQLDPPEGRALDKKERQMAGQLIAALEGDFDASEYQDEYRQRVMDLIDAKRTGGEIELEEFEPQPERESLSETLKASLANVG